MHVRKCTHACTNTVKHSHPHRKLVTFVLSHTLSVSPTFPLLPLPTRHLSPSFTSSNSHQILHKVVSNRVVMVSRGRLESCVPSKMYPRVYAGLFSNSHNSSLPFHLLIPSLWGCLYEWICLYVFCVFEGVWWFFDDLKKNKKTKQTNLVCAFVFLFMHECIMHIHVCAGVK